MKKNLEVFVVLWIFEHNYFALEIHKLCVTELGVIQD